MIVWTIRSLVFILVVGLAALAGLAVYMREPAAQATSGARPLAEPSSVPLADASLANAILERPPFNASRRPRTIAPAPPSVAAIEVRLTGLSVRGGKQRATLVINGQTLVVETGDDTPAGRVVEIDATGVSLGDPPRRVGF